MKLKFWQKRLAEVPVDLSHLSDDGTVTMFLLDGLHIVRHEMHSHTVTERPESITYGGRTYAFHSERGGQLYYVERLT